MAVKFLQSLVQRGAPVVGARVTGLDCIERGSQTPATLSMRQQRMRPEYRPDSVAALAAHGAGRSLGHAGVASTAVAINATRAVLSGWPVPSVTHRNIWPIGFTHPAPQALWG